jgi:hypothetical protein
MESVFQLKPIIAAFTGQDQGKTLKELPYLQQSTPL